ncbi:hypothetical protein BJV74DRAFT_857555 [Russula compacta]|nr:hypothetical protein BJV74DRAFT_857555 [Russula compacta]
MLSHLHVLTPTTVSLLLDRVAMPYPLSRRDHVPAPHPRRFFLSRKRGRDDGQARPPPRAPTCSDIFSALCGPGSGKTKKLAPSCSIQFIRLSELYSVRQSDKKTYIHSFLHADALAPVRPWNSFCAYGEHASTRAAVSCTCWAASLAC